MSFRKVMYSLAEVVVLIETGKNLLIAADESLLLQLPVGNWIAGTIPYFMAEEGGMSSTDLLQVTELPSYVENIKCVNYKLENIDQLYNDAYENGFSVLILPAFSEIHSQFAMNSPNYPGFATKPLIGWISGVLLSELGAKTPKTFCKSSDSASNSNAVVMHVEIPKTKVCEISIINIFEQGTGDSLEFPRSGFTANKVLVNGELKNFVEYVTENNLDLKLPLVADYCGAMINISFQTVDSEKDQVVFYAPLFEGVTYKQANPVLNYVKEFTDMIPTSGTDAIVFSCNCILNYLFSDLEGKKTGGITGPITFGEIAYQLVNQTMVNLEVRDIQ